MPSIGVSFFTFHQITYLMHVYRTDQAERDPIIYGLFVAFFPQLLAGPITYAREMLPQLRTASSILSIDMAAGITIFSIGLFKKVILADSVAPFADQLFYAAAHGVQPSAAEAWGGALAYSFQIYFDFSGYSDMAIGLARIFGYRLPLNFHAPYKAASIIDFWRRWHISLSRFLRDYLYIPLGGNRHGNARRLANLMITMLLGGLWHGAGWTFIVWGGLHGSYLVLNHLWQAIGIRLPTWIVVPLTFVAVTMAWVCFRADSIADAYAILHAMLGGTTLDGSKIMLDRSAVVAWLAACAAIVWLAPTTHEIIGRYGNAIDSYGQLAQTAFSSLRWKPNYVWGVVCAEMIVVALLTFDRPVRFLYFQF